MGSTSIYPRSGQGKVHITQIKYSGGYVRLEGMVPPELIHCSDEHGNIEVLDEHIPQLLESGVIKPIWYAPLIWL